MTEMTTTPPKTPTIEQDGTLSLKRVTLAALLTIGLFFGGLGGWAATAELSGAVIAPGEVIVETYRKQVQHLTGGIVEQILVREGDWVEKGQILIKLDGERARAARDMHRARMDTLQAQQARHNAAIDESDRVDWPEALRLRAEDPSDPESAQIAEILSSEERIFNANLAARDSQEALYRAEIQMQQVMIAGLEQQLRSTEQIRASLSEEIAAKRRLLSEGHIDLIHIMELERAQMSYQAEMDELNTDLDQAKQAVAAAELKIADLHLRYVQEAAEQLGEVRQAIVDLREQLRPAEDEVQRLDIRAPSSGVVVDLQVRTEGGVIRAGEPLMEIVPADGSLIISARVPPEKIDDVARGQRATVSLSAFSTRTTPKVTGRVSYVSADRAETSQESADELHYLAYVVLDEDSLQTAIGDSGRLTPGMPAEVYIQTEKRTMLSYLMRPLSDSINRSFRE